MATVHASAVLVGARAVLIQGASGSGKSRLALALIEAAGLLRFARLVADDRVELHAFGGRLLARAPAVLAGLIEVRGLGIRKMPYEACAVVGHVVDLCAQDAQRLPEPPARMTVVAGISLPRLAVASDQDPLPAVLALLRTTPS